MLSIDSEIQFFVVCTHFLGIDSTFSWKFLAISAGFRFVFAKFTRFVPSSEIFFDFKISHLPFVPKISPQTTFHTKASNLS
nr:MAG TPA: hypothetical protein [Caudoviricetes sp.]